jgi:DNA-binding transcriptional LysR family regulator
MLEEELGVRLFDRNGRGMIPTDAGELLLAEVGFLVRYMEEVRSEIQSFAGTVRGHVTVGMPEGLAEVIAANLIDNFITKYSETSVHFITSKGGYIYDWLQRGEIDVALLYDHQSDDTLIANKLLEEELYFVYKPGCLPTNHNSISFKEVCSLPLVLPAPQHALRGLLEAHAKSMGLSLNVQSDIDSLHVLMNMAAMGTYYTVLPRRALRKEVAAGTLEVHPIVDPTPLRTIYLVVAAGRPITTATRLFSDELKNAVSRLADSPL